MPPLWRKVFLQRLDPDSFKMLKASARIFLILVGITDYLDHHVMVNNMNASLGFTSRRNT